MSRFPFTTIILGVIAAIVAGVILFAVFSSSAEDEQIPTPTPVATETAVPTATDTPTVVPCADNEERWEDGTCHVVFPPEEPTPKFTPTVTPVIPLPDTGGVPPK